MIFVRVSVDFGTSFVDRLHVHRQYCATTLDIQLQDLSAMEQVPKSNSSYWTRRRRVKANVSAFIKEL